MKFSEMPPGQYVAYIKDWGLEEVAKLDNKVKVVIEFDIEVSAATGDMVQARWEGFLENKDGTPNKNTVKTVIICGFQGDDPFELTTKPDALKISTPYKVTVIHDGKYNKIQWVNSVESLPQGIKKITTKKKSSEIMKMAFKEAKGANGIAPLKPKNHAPGAEEDLPF